MVNVDKTTYIYLHTVWFNCNKTKQLVKQGTKMYHTYTVTVSCRRDKKESFNDNLKETIDGIKRAGDVTMKRFL